MTTRLENGAYDALKICNDREFTARVRFLVEYREFGLALLLEWIRIEAVLKLLKYHQRVGDGWPNNLKFLSANWKHLQMLKRDDETRYREVFGSGNTALRSVRNAAAHSRADISVFNYERLRNSGRWVYQSLSVQAPNAEALRRKKSAWLIRSKEIK